MNKVITPAAVVEEEETAAGTRRELVELRLRLALLTPAELKRLAKLENIWKSATRVVNHTTL